MLLTLTDRSPTYLASLVTGLRKQPHETEWLEFKTISFEPAEIGESLSVLSECCRPHRTNRAPE